VRSAYADEKSKAIQPSAEVAPAAGRRDGEHMNRGSGMGLLGFGIVLGVAGAIMVFAVKASTKGFSMHQGGIILLLVGIAMAVVGLLFLTLGGRSHSVTQESVQSTPTGEVRTQEHTDTGF
jgi:hypothetical protein